MKIQFDIGSTVVTLHNIQVSLSSSIRCSQSKFHLQLFKHQSSMSHCQRREFQSSVTNEMSSLSVFIYFLFVRQFFIYHLLSFFHSFFKNKSSAIDRFQQFFSLLRSVIKLSTKSFLLSIPK